MITSFQNIQVKWLQQLEKPKLRKTENRFIIEGLREIIHAVSAGYRIEKVFYCSELIPDIESFKMQFSPDVEFIELARHVFEKLVYRENSDGLIAVAHTRNFDISGLNLRKAAFVLVIEAIEKPGNLGAILRTADAAKVDAVIVADKHTDIFNPNVVRSSVGTLFTNNIAIGSNDEVFTFLKAHKFKIFSAALTAEKFYHETDFTGDCAVIMGTEAWGLSDFWLKNCDSQIKIPMRGKIDSLNVSVSTAVICFEAMRQRGF